MAKNPERALLIWIDAQLPPAAATWLRDLGESEVLHVRELGFEREEDPPLFAKAREAGAVVVTKDSDFVQLQQVKGAPPAVVWVTCGNIRNKDLRDLLTRAWPRVRELLLAGESLVEISKSRPAS
ncbi:MAG: DUF5615 family PIN-like protein [bacterium]